MRRGNCEQGRECSCCEEPKYRAVLHGIDHLKLTNQKVRSGIRDSFYRWIDLRKRRGLRQNLDGIVLKKRRVLGLRSTNTRIPRESLRSGKHLLAAGRGYPFALHISNRSALMVQLLFAGKARITICPLGDGEELWRRNTLAARMEKLCIHLRSPGKSINYLLWILSKLNETGDKNRASPFTRASIQHALPLPH